MVASDAAIELSLLRLLKDCSEDNQDSVRLLTAGACAPLAARCLPKGGLAPVAEVFQRVVKDVSWRVRYMAAESITQVVRACVRACVYVCACLWERFPQTVLPRFNAGSSSPCPHTRHSPTQFTQVVASDPWHANLVPMFVSLLGDGEAEVRSVAASKVFAFCSALPPATRAVSVARDILPRLSVRTRVCFSVHLSVRRV
jgi:hypothetical protein